MVEHLTVNKTDIFSEADQNRAKGRANIRLRFINWTETQMNAHVAQAEETRKKENFHLYLISYIFICMDY